MDEKLPYTLLPRKSSNELHGYGYYRRQRFNYRYPVRGRKLPKNNEISEVTINMI